MNHYQGTRVNLYRISRRHNQRTAGHCDPIDNDGYFCRQRFQPVMDGHGIVGIATCAVDMDGQVSSIFYLLQVLHKLI